MAVMGPSPPLLRSSISTSISTSTSTSTSTSWAAGATTMSSDSSSIVRRALTKRHHMRGSAIAGTAVGVILGVLLLIFCLYPFVVHYLKRRKRSSGASDTPFDPEAEIAAEPKEPDGQIERGQHRPSSDSSFRRNGPESTRGAEPPGGQMGWATPRTFYNGAPPGGQLGAEDGGGWADAGNYRVQAAPFPQLGCYDGEFAPRPSEDLEPGVLKGTSADYYSPSIPSEAFGMRTEPASMAEVDADAAARKSTRGSSLRHHIISMFHHKGSRDQTTDTIPDSIKEEPIITAPDEHVESPTELTPVTTTILGPPSTTTTTKAPAEIDIPDSSFHAGKGFAGAPSPPACPAPGTVNPMDIMPASTETEHWYRTEQELYGSYELSPGKPTSKPEATAADPAPYSLPTPRTSPQEASIQTFVALQPPKVLISPEEATEDTTAEPDGQTMLHPDGISASYTTSEQSPPFMAQGFTDVSSLNTPSTQLDTPSPESGGSYDYRLSGSPQPGQQGAQSPRKGVYQCDEPGCHQVFDLSHKLKHHQRYHSKDHKCPYSGCGKGFGTKTHLQRHINDRHERKKKFHCSIVGCDYSRTGGKAFPRKDNWKRHMMKIHNIDQQRLPEPVEADVDMNGM